MHFENVSHPGSAEQNSGLSIEKDVKTTQIVPVIAVNWPW